MFICLEDAQLTKYECKTKKTSHKPRDVSVIKILTFHSKAIEMLFSLATVCFIFVKCL